MSGLAETIARLRALKTSATGQSDRLASLANFGSNPGALVGHRFVPEGAASSLPLVVVLHGCTQSAASYDRGSGWSDLAERHGFALLYPEQQRSNNANGCFNWFEPQDIGRDRGEALSIRQMIAAMVERHAIDPACIYITGLSAGGAMANVMLAVYPELFAGGAIIAGLPFGTAHGVPQALQRMRATDGSTAVALGDLVRRASGHTGRWPTVSVWHGAEDRTVVPANAAAIVDQWRNVHGVAASGERAGVVDGHRHRSWADASGRVVVEEYRIAGFGHATPLDASGPEGVGAVGPHMLEAGISSTVHIARSWQLLRSGIAVTGHRVEAPAPGPAAPKPQISTVGGSVGDVIEKALRSAGLMK